MDNAEEQEGAEKYGKPSCEEDFTTTFRRLIEKAGVGKYKLDQLADVEFKTFWPLVKA